MEFAHCCENLPQEIYYSIVSSLGEIGALMEQSPRREGGLSIIPIPIVVVC